MPSDRTPADREPAPDHEGQGAGSVVVGPDPSSPAGTTLVRVRIDSELLRERMDALAVVVDQLRESAARMAPVLQQAGQEMRRALAAVRTDPPMSEYDAGDGMRWTPPTGGEETPPCPA